MFMYLGQFHLYRMKLTFSRVEWDEFSQLLSLKVNALLNHRLKIGRLETKKKVIYLRGCLPQ